jgi:hypothetical protein
MIRTYASALRLAVRTGSHESNAYRPHPMGMTAPEDRTRSGGETFTVGETDCRVSYEFDERRRDPLNTTVNMPPRINAVASARRSVTTSAINTIPPSAARTGTES